MPTESGRESAAERKVREAAENQAQAEQVTDELLARTGIVLRLRPQNISVHVGKGDIPQPDGGIVEGDLISLELAIPGALVNIEFPLVGAPRIAAEIFAAWKAHQEGENGGLIQAKDIDDVKRAAAAAVAAQQLREDEAHG